MAAANPHVRKFSAITRALEELEIKDRRAVLTLFDSVTTGRAAARVNAVKRIAQALSGDDAERTRLLAFFLDQVDLQISQERD